MSTASAEKKVFIVQHGGPDQLYYYFNNKCTPLSEDPDVRVDPDGYIWYSAWRNISFEEAKLASTIIYPPSRSGKILGAGSSSPQGIVVRKITGDDGRIETAIRAMDHILESTKKREAWFDPIWSGMAELDDLLGRYGTVSDEEFVAARIRIFEMLEQAGIAGFNPPKIHDRERKSRMAELMLKASWGTDSWGRPNPLIVMEELAAAYRIAEEIHRVIPETATKYLRMREALAYERNYTRINLGFVVSQLDPNSDFMYLLRCGTSEKDQQTVMAQLGHLMYLLDKPRVRMYKTIAQRIREHVISKLDDQHVPVWGLKDVLIQGGQLLKEELEAHADVNATSS